ncbi:MAG: GAF domain-containing sensor histidine kinase [Polyangiaceae bacterium]|nr:GAF domain-containing sensor histidine kinase [Polyangiaceae bacterium]
MARAEVRDPERLRAILESATRMAADQLEVERVGVWIIDPEAGTLTQGLLYVRSTQSHSREPTVLSVADHPEYFEAMEQRRALVVEDTRASPHAQTMFREVLEPHRIGSLLDTPIFRQGVLVGVVCHEHVGGPRKWLPREIDFAASVADMVALYFEEAEAAHVQRLLLLQERELLQAERLASVGILARHVAHDLNNAVAPILLCAAQLKTALAGDPRMLERVQIILDAAEHGVALARRLLTAAAGGPLRVRQAVALDAMLSDAASLLRAVAGDEIDLVLDLQAFGAYVEVDPIELVRAVINLVTNARDAMPRGGRVTLRTSEEAGRVSLEVADEGLGMTSDEQDQLFQPFFTTKPGKGSGLGLAGVRTMVEGAKGSVRVTSAPSSGTTVTLDLPAAVAAETGAG